MLQFLLPALIGAGGSLLGGLFNQQAQERENRIARQREDTAIQRQKADAIAAGINPLAALGVSGAGSASMPVADLGGSIERAAGGVASSMVEEATFALNAAQTLSNIKLQDAQAKAMLMEAQSRTVASRLEAASRGGVGGELILPLPGKPGFRPSDTSKAQTVQDEYGDIVENVYGTGRLINDLIENLGAGIGSEWRPGTRNYSRTR